MKYLYLEFLLFITVFGFSQNNSAIVTYRLSVTVDDETMQVDKKYGYIQKAIDVASQLEYKLVIKNKEANFFQEKNDNLDKMSVNMANSLAEIPKNIYVNLEKNIVLNEINADGILIKKDEFIVMDSIKYTWNITNETKLIDNYLCYKATTTKKLIKKENEVIETVTAWFCPSIPYSFGPSKYAALPGIILELQEKNIAFVIKSIKLLKEEEAIIHLPTSKKTITQAEYNKLLDERLQTLETMSKQ